jgi:cyclic pyranopterin phosphate synthase
MPEEMVFLPNAELMQDDEVLALVRLFARLGFDKIRLTGGEPTVRLHVVDLVREIAHTPGVRSLSMTTNGILLSRLAEHLAQAGLQRVNISLDSLDEHKFHSMTRWGTIEQVWEGIMAAERAGLTPIKINSVVVRGYNESEIVDLAMLTLTRPWQLRFIEMMPFAGATDFQQDQVVAAAQILERLETHFGKLEIINQGRLDGEARLYRIPDAPGEIGIISSVTQPFCATCTRARLTADGRLRLCLLREGEVDLLTPLREGADEEELRNIILDGIWNKPWGHGLADGVIPLNRVMNQIGG